MPLREAVNQKADRVVDDPEFIKMAEETKRRVEEADLALRERVLAGH